MGGAAGTLASVRTIALVGNPNVGKTTLFNRLSGLRQKTSNFPGTTQEAHVGVLSRSGREDAAHVRLIDLPGVYGLGLDTSESRVCRGVLEGTLAPSGEPAALPDAVLIVLDATNLRRNLELVREASRFGRPVVVAVNLIDAARRQTIHVDAELFASLIGAPVVLVSARTGEGLGTLRELLSTEDAARPAGVGDEAGWADDVYARVASAREDRSRDTITDRLDRAFTHPLLGLASFTVVMTALFWAIFRLAAYPMDWIDGAFGSLGAWLTGTLPGGLLSELLIDGVVAGVGATLVFLPQIMLLSLLITLLEQTGYLARAAFVIDRVLRPFGLPGHAFVPLLSAHACALPAIMSARGVPDRRDRLATILVIPFMSCTARIPVYVLLTALLFPDRPGMQALAFTGCYVLGVCAGLLSALVARRTILRGKSRGMALELPAYRVPDARTAILTTIDRGWIFLRKAGTVILAISVVLWWLGTFPKVDPPAEATELREVADRVEAGEIVLLEQSDAPLEERASMDAEGIRAEADAREASHAARASFLGRLGVFVEPVFEPIGADRQLTVGILASFAAREVFAATMAVQVLGRDDAEGEGTFAALGRATRDDGSPLFTPAASWSMLVYFVLAMQCLPTLVVTARESGGWKWAGVQFAWMTIVAYVGALLAYEIASALLGGAGA
ncbi:MAG: ferrous iron transporter B [Phycisphaerales bacterium]|jgi:ferrous iron transport protein B|nr:ferrous iron transporter B [Phycisphaerales bacterium]